MAEKFKLKKIWSTFTYVMAAISLIMVVVFIWMYFFEEDEAVFLFISVFAGVGSVSSYFAIKDMQSFFVEVSEKGITTHKITFTWDKVQKVEYFDQSALIHYKDQSDQSKKIAIGAIIDGYDYLVTLVKKYSTKNEVKDG